MSPDPFWRAPPLSSPIGSSWRQEGLLLHAGRFETYHAHMYPVIRKRHRRSTWQLFLGTTGWILGHTLEGTIDFSLCCEAALVMAIALRQQRLLLLLQSPSSLHRGVPVARSDLVNHKQLVHVYFGTQGGRFLGKSSGFSSSFSKNVRCWPTFKHRSRGFPGQVLATYGNNKHETKNRGTVVTWVVTSIRRLAKAVGIVILVIGLIITGTPAYLSWPTGLGTAVAVVNHFIPGTLSVKSASLGWAKPVRVNEISLMGVDGRNVLHIPKVESKAPLWSIVLGRAGLGETAITSPVIDYQQDEKTGLPRLALALAPEDKLRPPGHAGKKKKQLPVKEKPVNVELGSKLAVPNGNLEVINGKLVLPADLAAILGKRVHVEVSGGELAKDLEGELQERAARGVGIPTTAVMWAESVEAKAVGLFHSRQGRLELIKPILVEADLTPELAHIYLVRVNPLLGDILGPAVRDEDMPDVIVHITPNDMMVPADQYMVQIDPMKVILGRGPLINGILSLLSKEKNVAPANRELTMQTSSIEANVSMQGDLECSRMDVLLADNVHVATWGYINWIQETMKMTIAIPGSTLERLLGVTGLPDDYYLKIPVSGTFERPTVDWKAAGVGIAQLTLRQRGGGAFLNLWNMLDGRKEQPAPRPKHALPWKLR